MIRTLERVTYLAPFLLPENGRWRVSFGLTSERHIFSRGYYLVLGLNHKLGWDWEGEKEKGAGIQWYLVEQASIVSLPPEVSSDPPVLPFLSILLQTPSPILALQSVPGEPLTMNTERARCLHAAHTVLCHTGVSPLVFSTHSANPKAVVTLDLIPV